MSHPLRAACALILLLLAPGPVLAQVAGGQPIPIDLPSREIRLGGLFDPVPAWDGQVVAFGMADGRAATVILENFKLQSQHSMDGGAGFSAEVLAAGGEGDLPVRPRVDTVDTADGKLYAAFPIADPAGDVGIRFARSDDFGMSWLAPVDLLRNGDAQHGVRCNPEGGCFVRISANAAGIVAVAFVRQWGDSPFVRVSSDGGQTWQPWVRVDAGVLEGDRIADDLDLLVESGGDVHVAFVQGRGDGDEIFYTRSTDGGATFDAERSLDPDLPVGGRAGAAYPDLAQASDGSILLALWDSVAPDRALYVVRSTDGGSSFDLTLARSLSGSDMPSRPVLKTYPESSTVLLGMVVIDHEVGSHLVGTVTLQRSDDDGASFGSPQTVASDGVSNNEEPVSLVLTPSGEWVAGWRDVRDDVYIGRNSDLYARSSSDDGVTWSSDQRVDRTAAGFVRSSFGNLTRSMTNDVLAAYCDGRDDTRDVNVYTNRSLASSLDFSTNEQRSDTDAAMRNVGMSFSSTLTHDGGTHLYVATASGASNDGDYNDIWVTSSSDGGLTFGAPVRASTSPAGSLADFRPQIAATADGYVYVAYYETASGTLENELRINSSTDFGATWQLSDSLLGVIGPSGGNQHPQFDLVALPGGRAWVAWSDGIDVHMARTTDGGDNYTTADVDQDSRAFRTNRHPALCAEDDRVVLVYQSRIDAPPNPGSIWAQVSEDGGVSFAPRVDLRTTGSGTWAHLPHVACGDGRAVAVWADKRDTPNAIYSSAFDGSTWSSEIQLRPATDFAHNRPKVDHVGVGRWAVTWGDGGVRVWFGHSDDGGASFTTRRLDGTALRQAAASERPNLASDGLGNVWVSWLESSPGLPTMAVRHSSDWGASFTNVRRLSDETSQGGFENLHWFGDGYAVGHDGAAFFVWAGERDAPSPEYDLMFGVWDLDDLDHDGSATGTDCDDSDPGAFAIPSEVTGMALEKLTGATRLSWASLATAAGDGTIYDLATGSLADLRSTGAYSSVSCLVAGVTDTTFDDTSGDPAPGSGDYFLARATNGCGDGTYGDGSPALDPRDALDVASPCP